MMASLQRCQARLPHLLERYLPPEHAAVPIASAMRYACLNGGKRLRPYLVYLAGEMFGASWSTLDPIAVAIELIHCYSLVHDDLPAMDNDDLRRGKPTCHKQFDEATAILAGDGLLTLAFDILSDRTQFPTLSESAQLNIIRLIAQASGAQGMIRGQAEDLSAQGQQRSFEALCHLHAAKTGALITVSIQCGALASGQASETAIAHLHRYGQAIGLAFQIQDDLLDEFGSDELIGKRAHKDAKNQKCTFVTQFGAAQALAYAREYYAKALSFLDPLGPTGEPLRQLSQYLMQRVA